MLVDPSQYSALIDQICAGMNNEELAAFLSDPAVRAIMDATLCPDSDKAEHSWPFHVIKQEEATECIFCGKTKRQVMMEVVNVRRNRRGGPVRPKGERPKRTTYEGSFKIKDIDAEIFRKIFEGS